jgi:hypothetical protein
MFRNARRNCIWILLGCLPLIAACGVREDKLAETGATLSGTITYQGNPIEFAMITVKGTNGSPAYGKVGPDMKYRVENVPLGEVQVSVNTSAAQGDFQTKIRQQNQTALDPSASTKISAPKFVDVPQKYFDPATSGLKTTVQKGENTYDITVE